MINKEDEKNRLEDKILEKVTGGSTGEKRFQCPFCSVAFYTYNEVINHVSVRHRSMIE